MWFADNYPTTLCSPIVKNITYCAYPIFTVFCLRTDSQITDFAKISPHILNPEKFALHLATFFVSKYAHISKAFVAVEQLRWSRIHVTGEESPEGHSHSFYRDGDDKRIVKVEVGVLLSNSCLSLFSLIIVITLWNIGRRNSWERQVGRQSDSRPLGSSGCVDSLFRPIAERKINMYPKFSNRPDPHSPSSTATNIRRLLRWTTGFSPHPSISPIRSPTSRSQRPQTRRNSSLLCRYRRDKLVTREAYGMKTSHRERGPRL